jgi:MFS family permease
VWLAAAIVLLAAFWWIEQRVKEPIMPIDLFKTPLIARTNAVAFLFGTAMFGAIAFIPLFVQGVFGGSATEAGQVLTPLFMGWVISSITSARLTVRVGYRRVALTGNILLISGFLGLVGLDADASRAWLYGSCMLMGLGMGSCMLALLLAVQHGVERARLGIATSLNQFSRSIGAAVGVSMMGAVMARALSGMTLPGGAEGLAPGGLALTGAARVQFAGGLHQVFIAGAITASVALVVTLLLPAVSFETPVKAAAGEELLAAEMTTLEPEDEPLSMAE